ncbi:Ig-like domain-containing protein [Dactylosporangium sp. CS-047395]|uniref:Ig-like domain-containing protein n=1 Tax=Dactylosporangium sp. CS-047395 TaxID=3239936 RepID=UPI003D919A25
MELSFTSGGTVGGAEHACDRICSMAFDCEGGCSHAVLSRTDRTGRRNSGSSALERFPGFGEECSYSCFICPMKSTIPAALRTTGCAAAAIALVAGTAIAVLPAAPAGAAGDPAPLVISEFRVRGPNGANDEFIEIANTSGSPHTVAATSGTGYGIAASDGTTRCTIPNGTVIPGRGHYLCVNSAGYSLTSYPAGSGTTATGDATYTTGIADNAGIALFDNNTGGASYTLASRLDAVGSTSETNTLYKEGTGYSALTPFSIDYSFYRSLSTELITGRNVLTTPTPGVPKDTGNNGADFVFVDTNGTSAGAGQRLGAPGPENLSSPVSGGGLAVSLLNDCASDSAAPNAARETTSNPANNSTFGTLTYRRTITNTTGTPISRLRLRIADVRTFPAPSGYADLRPRTGSGGTVTVDRTACGGASADVPVVGTTLEQAPSQPNGGGFNSSLAVALAQPLAAGASVNVNILMGVQQTGINGVRFIAEALPGAGAGTPALTCAGATITDEGASYCSLAPPTIAAPAANAVLTSNAVTVSGTGGTDGATVTASIVGPAPATTVTTCTDTAGSSGSWSCTPSSPLTDGAYTVRVAQRKAADDPADTSAPVAFTIDAAPPVPTVSAPSASAVLTNGAVTVSGSGGKDGATVTATIVGPAPASTATTCTSGVGSGGSWSCTPASALADGSYSLTVKQTDAASKVSANSPSISFAIDSEAPAVPTVSAPSAGAMLTNGAVAVSGSGGENGATVTATLVGPAPASTATTCTSGVGSGGSWSCTPASPLADGSYSLTVKQTDAATNASGNTAPVSFTIDSEAPAVPTVAAPSAGAVLANDAVTVSGSGENGATVTATLVGPAPASTATTCTTTVGSGGSWSCSPASPPANGSYSLTVKQTDAAGNASTDSAPVSFTVVPPAPTVTGLTPLVGPANTAGTSIVISGTHLTGATAVTFGGVAAASFTVDSDSQLTAVAPAGPTGSVDVTVTTPGGPATSTMKFVYTQTADPAVPATVPALAGEIVSSAGTSGATVTASQDVTFSGRNFAPGSTVTVVLYSTPAVLGTAPVLMDGTFSVTLAMPADLAAGTHTVTASGFDASGNPRYLGLALNVAAASSPATEPAQPSTGGALPVTGNATATVAEIGLGLFIIGLMLATTGRRPKLWRRRS